MFTLIIKLLIAGSIVTFVSTYGSKLPRVGSIIAVLPIMTMLTFSIMIFNDEPITNLTRLAYNIALTALMTVLYPLSFYLLTHYLSLSSLRALFASVVPLLIGYWIMFPFLKP